MTARRAGTKSSVVNTVQARLRSSSNPMLAVPGWLDRARDPKAVPVVSAEKITPRAVAEPRNRVMPARKFMTK